jgi:NAD-dependent deacetylase
MLESAAIARAATILRGADRVLFVTGAGISADSGLPTYRGIGGLYEGAVTEEGVAIEDALSGAMLEHDPGLCWKYIAHIERACRGASFNPAHAFLAEVERALPGTWVLTQNVDGFHRAAGSRNVIEIHGDIHRLICVACTRRDVVPDFARIEIPPRCPGCAGLVRPEVVLFGEMLPDEAVQTMRRELAKGFDAVVSIGTTSAFPYIAWPVISAAGAGIPTIEINPGESEVSHLVALRLRARAVEALTAIRELWHHIGR